MEVAKAERPVVFVLTAYQPLVWKVAAPKGAVVRVIACGRHKEVVEGLDGAVPVTLLSEEAGDEDFFYAYDRPDRELDRGFEQTKRELEEILARAKEKNDPKQVESVKRRVEEGVARIDEARRSVPKVRADLIARIGRNLTGLEVKTFQSKDTGGGRSRCADPKGRRSPQIASQTSSTRNHQDEKKGRP